jgi:hypothetical protein
VATQTITELLDDLDGGTADETVSFELDGVAYEIDLSAANAQALRESFTRYQEAGRQVGGRRRPAAVPTGVDNSAVRAWAASNGVELPARGRIPATVIDQYRAAGN